MVLNKFKILTLSMMAASIFLPSLYAQSVSQEALKTHLRWRLQADQNQVEIKFEKERVILKTLDKEFFDKISENILKIDKDEKYIRDYSFNGNGLPLNPAVIIVDLKGDEVDVFSFYKDATKEYVVDFWVNNDQVATKKAAVVKKVQPNKSIKKVKTVIPAVKKVAVIPTVVPLKPLERDISADASLESTDQAGYRDFRYGAAKIWDYAAFIPPLVEDIKISNKGPDYLYSVENMDNLDDEKNAHMQLTINFYKKSDWGLMARSVGLYEKKYGVDKYKDLNDFMKASSLIKNSIKEKVAPKEIEGDEDNPAAKITKNGSVFSAMNLLANISERTNDYGLKQASIRYLLQYAINGEDYVKSLQLAKKLYVVATQFFDDAMIVYSSKVILHSLANLGQMDKIEEFLSNKAVIRLLPKQEGIAYTNYVELKKNNLRDVVKIYEKYKTSIDENPHAAILVNTAEAYFRLGNYDAALKIYDKFNTMFTFLSPASYVRVRMALIYDLQNKPIKETLTLYENAINRSTKPAASFEAKLRYIGLKLVRKKNITKEDHETLAFFKKTDGEHKDMNKDLWKLLWIVRMRSYIAIGDFEKALAYLSTVPLESMPAHDRDIFELDASEVILGLIKKNYLDKNYARVVKTWELYKDKFKDKILNNPYTNYLAAESYLELELGSLYSQIIENLSKLKDKNIVRSFPNWVTPHKKISIDELITELNLVAFFKTKSWDKLDYELSRVEENRRDSVNYDYYKGIIEFNRKKYEEAIKLFENLIVKNESVNKLTPDQTAQMLNSYVESLYQLEDQVKFRKNAIALLEDTDKIQSSNIDSIRERISYLLLESYFSDKKVDYGNLQRMAKDFKLKYSKTKYAHRVNYILGMASLRSSNSTFAKEVFEELIKDKETPSYLKELAKSELATMAIKEKNI